MRYGFEIASFSGGIGLIALANLVVVEFLPFIVPMFNMMGGLLLILPPLMLFYTRFRIKKEIEEQFISFVMDLTDSIDSGMTLPMALENCAKRDYQALSGHVDRLVAQVNWGIPFRQALGNFAKKTRSRPVQRAVSTIIETYRVGGKISDTLNSVTKSMMTMSKLEAERRSSVHSQVVTSYMIFFIFIFIMVVIHVFIIPSMSPENLSGISVAETSTPLSMEDYSRIFTAFIVIQGFFAGLATGKMSEGSLTAGIKHSMILIFVGYGIFSLASQLPQLKFF